MTPVADEQVIFESPDPAEVYCYSPSLCGGFDGRIVAGFDLGGRGVARLGGAVSRNGDWGAGNQQRFLLSDDGGRSWRESRTTLPMLHSIVFRAGDALYVLGSDDRLLISRSDDNGESWSEIAVLDESRRWAQTGCRVNFHGGRVYLAYECVPPETDWCMAVPVLLSACTADDLRKRASWRFSEPFPLHGAVAGTRNLGIPYYPVGEQTPDDPVDRRLWNGDGALESNVWRITDPDQQFYDPEQRTVMISMRTNAGLGNLGLVLRGVEAADGALRIEPLKTPAGETMLFVPLPGGQMKFDLDYDPVSRLYWLLSTQCTDCLRRPDRMPEDRFYLPFSERRRLQLHFSRNGFDWCFAGIIAVGPRVERASRHYASLLIHGDDLLVLSRSGDERAVDAHNGNLLTLHRVREFRRLAY